MAIPFDPNLEQLGISAGEIRSLDVLKESRDRAVVRLDCRDRGYVLKCFPRDSRAPELLAAQWHAR